MKDIIIFYIIIGFLILLNLGFYLIKKEDSYLFIYYVIILSLILYFGIYIDKKYSFEFKII